LVDIQQAEGDMARRSLSKNINASFLCQFAVSAARTKSFKDWPRDLHFFADRLNEWIQYSKFGVLSKDGKCKDFVANADDFGRVKVSRASTGSLLKKAIKGGDGV
jgi:hypothetical protein